MVSGSMTADLVSDRARWGMDGLIPTSAPLRNDNRNIPVRVSQGIPPVSGDPNSTGSVDDIAHKRAARA